MIDNIIFKTAEERLYNALNDLEVEENLVNKSLDRKIRYSHQMIELEDKIKKYNSKIEKLSKKAFELADKIFNDIFVGDNFQKTDGNNIYARLDNGTNILLTFLKNLTLKAYLEFFQNNVKSDFKLKTVEDLEFFINNISQERLEFLIENSLVDIKFIRNNLTHLAKESKKKLNRVNRILSATDKIINEDFNLIKSLNEKKEVYQNNYENFILALPLIGEIEKKLNNAKTALNGWQTIFNEYIVTSYKDAVKKRNSYVNYKETLIADVKEKSAELNHVKEAKSKENIKRIVEKCITKEEIKQLKHDPEFLIKLGTIKKSKIQNKATKLLITYLIKEIAPKEQQISK